MSFDRYSIGRSQVPVIVAAGQTVGTAARTFNGILEGVTVVVPILTGGSPTVTFSIADVDGTVLYTSGTLASNTKTFIGSNAANGDLNVPLSGNHTVTVTVSTAQTPTVTVNVNLLTRK